MALSTSPTHDLLHAQGLTVAFGGVRALSNFTMRVREAQLVGLIGPNGAGKTTALDALSGFVPAEGTIRFRERDVTRSTTVARVRAGLVRTWQSAELFEGLTVGENLRVAAERSGLKQIFADVFGRRRPASESVRHALDLVGCEDLLDRIPGQLSHGERKLVGVARALAAQPRLILLDEPSAGLDSRESDRLGAQLVSMVEQGLTLVLVEHDMEMVLGICDYIYVIDGGTLICEGSPAEIQRDPAVIASYLGADNPLSRPDDKASTSPDAEILRSEPGKNGAAS
jgi:branched-chain amino acid transport system ATP-binding protein